MDTLRMRFSRLCSVLLLMITPFVYGTETGPVRVNQAAGLSGTLSSAGSDTLHNMMTVWRREFVLQHPQLNIQIQSSGSATAPVALVEGTANLGPMSRTMLTVEQDRFRRRFGYEAYAVPVALDTPI